MDSVLTVVLLSLIPTLIFFLILHAVIKNAINSSRLNRNAERILAVLQEQYPEAAAKAAAAERAAEAECETADEVPISARDESEDHDAES